MGVHPHALALRLRLAAGGEDLLVAQRLPAALADALGGENLDHVGAVGDGLPDMLPDLIGRHGGFADRETAVNSREPGILPRAMASRSGTSLAAPMLCTVVKPAISIA